MARLECFESYLDKTKKDMVAASILYLADSIFDAIDYHTEHLGHEICMGVKHGLEGTIHISSDISGQLEVGKVD